MTFEKHTYIESIKKSMSLDFLFFILINIFQSKQADYPSYIIDYFDLITTIDQPISLPKHYQMQQSSIDFYPGTMNIFFTVPHDGDIKSNLPSRPKGACRKLNSTNAKCYYQNPCSKFHYRLDTKSCSISQGRDRHTRLLALALRYEFNELFRLKPFILINRIERTKIDLNRYIDEGTFFYPQTMHAWMNYHFYLKHIREMIISNEYNFDGKGLLFDLHSQEHEQGWIELGYLITSRQLSTKKYHLNMSSLASYLTNLYSSDEILIGNKSLGYFLTKYNYSATPSPKYPTPPKQSYFEWGYTIDEYGRYKNFSAIMIESPAKELVNLTNLYFYAKSLALAIHDYIIEIELFEALIRSEVIEMKCHSKRQMYIQRQYFLLLFFSLINVI